MMIPWDSIFYFGLGATLKKSDTAIFKMATKHILFWTRSHFEKI